MSTKKAEDSALTRVRQRAQFKPSGEGDSAAAEFDAPFKAFIKASDPRPAAQVGVVDEAVSLAIGDVVRRTRPDPTTITVRATSPAGLSRR